MKVIQVYNPFQSESTVENVQLIDGIKKSWCVMTERSQAGESYIDWIRRKKEYVENRGIEGIYLYDVEALSQRPCIGYNKDTKEHEYGEPEIQYYIRYDYIKWK